MHQTNAAAFFHPFYTGDINPGIVESNSLGSASSHYPPAIYNKYGQNIFGRFICKRIF